MQELKKKIKKFFHFLWYDDSLLSWTLNIIIAFILIKYVVYPLLALLFGTALPVVAVISQSMYQEGGFDTWWGCTPESCTSEDQGYWYLQQNITKEQFKTFSLSRGFAKGDVIVLRNPSNIEQGEVIVFQAQKAYPIIHRVFNIIETETGERIYQTKGDSNTVPIQSFDLDELEIREEQLIGRAILRIPYLGYPRVWLMNILSFLGIA